mmetsp:Transcript_9902/g.29926  ORF Transcript_9902/g.29926 Transcript_9902/m.29926 type:complete len:871 (+) Transcript_9902:80-2692(+)
MEALVTHVQLENTNTFVEEGLKEQLVLATTLKKWQAIEASYGRELGKLYQSCINKSKHDGAAAGGVGLRDTIAVLHDEINAIATQHERLASQLAATAESLRQIHGSVDSARKTLVSEYSAHFRSMQENHTQLRKMQSQVSTFQRDHKEALAQKVRQSVKVPNKLGATGAKGGAAEAKLHGRVQQTAAKTKSGMSTLSHMATTCSQLRHTHYKSVLPKTLERLATLEHDRAESVVRGLRGWASGRLQNLRTEWERSESFSELLKSCDAGNDLQRFAQLNVTSEAAMPATALVDCTHRGLIQAISGSAAEVKGTTWKMYLFVLYARERKLLQYDGEDALQPRMVHTLMKMDKALLPTHETLFHRENVFQLRTTSGLLFIDLADPRERDTWIERLQQTTGMAEGMCAAAETERTIRTIELGVLEAKDVGKPGDYHCVIAVEGAQVAQTYTQFGTEVPFWGQEFVFDDISSACYDVVISLRRRVTGLVRKSGAGGGRGSEQIGELRVSLRDRRLEAGKWLKMQLSDYDASIRIRLRHSTTRVLPLTHYGELAKRLVFGADMAAEVTLLRALNGVIDPVTRPRLSESLLKCTGTLHYLHALCEFEVECTTDHKVYLRGNSLMTASVDKFMKVVAIETGSFLQDTLGELIRSVCEQKLECEVDPTRVSDPKEAELGLEQLGNITQTFWDAICGSFGKLPPQLRDTFAFLHERATAKFPAEAEKHTGVKAFLFLRLLCPAMLGPHLFGLQKRCPDPGVLRTLTLVSICIQNLANGINFGAKQPHLIGMNAFLARNGPAMQRCLVDATKRPENKPEPELNLGLEDKARMYADFCALLRDTAKRGDPSKWPDCALELLKVIDRAHAHDAKDSHSGEAPT